MTEIKNNIINTPEFFNNKSKKMTNINNKVKENISINTSKYRANAKNPLNLKKSTENNSAKISLYGSIRNNKYRPSISEISAEKIHGKTLDEKMDIYLANQDSLNKSIQTYMEKQDDTNQSIKAFIQNQKVIYQALMLNLQQLSGDVKNLKKNKK